MPDEVNDFSFNLSDPSGRTRQWSFTQPLTEMSTRSRKTMFLGVEGSRCVALTTLPQSVSRFFRQCEILNMSQPYRPPTACYGDSLTLHFTEPSSHLDRGNVREPPLVLMEVR
jgi:hypothetical protein